ncbi:MAG TPA: transglutaminase domain-containing protein [Dehalococcoidia bacterium]|nr:transglutaminase domain-containing protein [Dehalococcoidia bacterium]
MKAKKAILAAFAPLLLGLLMASPSHASPSERFYQRDGHIFDSWNVCRTRAEGSDGFLKLSRRGFDPLIAKESLGDNIDLAWELGREFARKYPDPHQRAESIFYFVRNKVIYTSDADQFGFRDFAQNADEVAEAIAEKGLALGDCEDSAILLAVMYKAAGYRSAVVLAPGHLATLVYLPGYRKAARVLQIAGEEGWVWTEPTGRTNPFGWLPERYAAAQLVAREITMEAIAEREPSAATATTVTKSSGDSGARFFPFFGVIGLLWLISSARRRPPKRKRRFSPKQM